MSRGSFLDLTDQERGILEFFGVKERDCYVTVAFTGSRGSHAFLNEDYRLDIQSRNSEIWRVELWRYPNGYAKVVWYDSSFFSVSQELFPSWLVCKLEIVVKETGLQILTRKNIPDFSSHEVALAYSKNFDVSPPK